MNLTIINAETGEPLVVLGQDEMGMRVTGLDPKWVETLGLNKFKSLDEIADYLNESGGQFQAMFDDEGENAPEENPNNGEANASGDDRLKPALDIIKELLSRVDQKRKQEEKTKSSTSNEAEALNITDSEVVQQPPKTIYVSIDGDNIGNMVAQTEERDDEQALSEISQRINAGQQVFNSWAQQMGGQIIEAGGDEGLAKVPGTAMDKIEELRVAYNKAVGATCTVGIGEKISQSTKARMLGKLKGKDQVVVFDEATEKEIKLRLKDKDVTEANKIRTAMGEQESPEEQGAPVPVNAESQGESEQEKPEMQGEPAEEKEEAPKKEEPKKEAQAEGKKKSKEESKETGVMSPQLIKAVGELKPEPRAPKSLMGNYSHDPEIESQDFSDRDDPELAKRLQYALKYGRQ